ncbi:MAG: hypothetical protein SFV20_12850 [Sphingopyxis sp.]|nr:hypothetical protein [Sphingopyxis sp.]
MSDFGYSKRSRAVEEARSDIVSAFADVANRWDKNDPRTQRWMNAVAKFRAAIDNAYSGTLADFARGNSAASAVKTSDILDFLEADPMFFGSGYLKERVLTALKQRKLERPEIKRLQRIILGVVGKADRRREIRDYCRVAVHVDSQNFRRELQAIEGSENKQIALRANWVLAALDGRFVEIAQKSRMLRLMDGTNIDAFENARISRGNE